MWNKVKKIFMRRKVPRLPDAYQEVDYIQSSGTQYMVIWTSFKTSYKVVIDFQMTVIWGDYIPIWIHYSNSSSTNIKYWIDAYSSYFKVAGGDWSNTIPEDTNRHIITIDKNVATVDGTNYTINYTNYTFSQWIWVFCYNEYHLSPQYNYKSSNKLYKLDIYDENWSHIYNLVPCYRKSDNVIGLYDLVNNQFYTNSWSGTFTKGTDSSTLELKEFQVRPDEWWTLSWYRDFTTATKSALEWEWWGGQGWWSWSVSSSWLTTSRSTTDRSYLVSLPIQINTQAKSIKIYWLINRSVGSWYGSFQWGIRATNTCGSGRDDYPTGDWLIAQSANCNNNSWYMWYGAGSDVLWFTGPGQWNTSNLWYSGSDITVEAIIDLDGGTCSCSYKSGSTTIWSWSTTFDSATVKATLSGLSTNQYLSVFNRNGTWDYKYMKNFGYEIIY